MQLEAVDDAHTDFHPAVAALGQSQVEYLQQGGDVDKEMQPQPQWTYSCPSSTGPSRGALGGPSGGPRGALGGPLTLKESLWIVQPVARAELVRPLLDHGVAVV